MSYETGSDYPNGDTSGLRVGVVGCGYWGAKHVRVLDSLPEVEQVVAIDHDDMVRKAIIQRHPHVRGADSLESAIDSIDALVVATPPQTHAPLARAALSHGKHVLVEKPLTTNTDDAVDLIEEAERRDLTLMVGHTFEYNAAVWRLREAVQTGELGDVYYIDTARLNLGLYQPDVNVVWDLAPHDVSILNHVLGAEPSEVSAQGHMFANEVTEDVAYISLRYENIGAEAHVHVSWLDPCKVRRVTVVGSEKMAVYNDVATEEKLRIFDKGVGPAAEEDGNGTAPMSYRYGNIVSPFIDFTEPLQVEDQHFIDCIRTGKVPMTDGRSGYSVVAVLEAAQESIRMRRPVPVRAPSVV